MPDLDLLHGSAEHLAELLGCSLRTAHYYRAGRQALPEPSRRLLLLLRAGDLSVLLGDDWAGFSFDRHGLLYAPGWQNGFTPQQIRGMFYGYQELAARRSDADRGRRGHGAIVLQDLADLVRLQPGNDGNAADDDEGEVLAIGHSVVSLSVVSGSGACR